MRADVPHTVEAAAMLICCGFHKCSSMVEWGYPTGMVLVRPLNCFVLPSVRCPIDGCPSGRSGPRGVLVHGVHV
jgi:hypothetical protein